MKNSQILNLEKINTAHKKNLPRQDFKLTMLSAYTLAYILYFID